MRKRNILLWLPLLIGLPAGLQAQTMGRQVVAASGGTVETGSILADYTVGEGVINTLTGGGLLLTQGFQQPEGGGNIHVAGMNPVSVSYSLYPSPAQDNINLKLTAASPETVRITITSAAGAVIYRQEPVSIYPAYSGTYPVGAYAAGIYFLNIYNHADGLMKSIRFVKK